MATRKIKDAKDTMTNELIYFKGHAKATYMSDGRNVEEAIHQIGTGGGGGGITAETDPIFSASPAASITEEKKTEWDNKMDKVTLATVATSGNYNDLSNRPTIPSAVTESTVSGWGFTKNLGTITEIQMNGVSKGTSGVVDLGTVITEHQDISSKQDKLVSGTNLKTLNGESLLGSGDIEISGGSSSSKEVMEAPVVMMDGPLVITFANEPMLPNKVYVASSAINGIRDLSLATPEKNYEEYSLHFLVGDIIDMFVFPDKFRWANGASPLIDVNAYYELSIAAVKMNGEYIYKAVLTKF